MWSRLNNGARCQVHMVGVGPAVADLVREHTRRYHRSAQWLGVEARVDRP